MKIENIKNHLKEKLKDPYFKEIYELEEQKLEIVKRIIAYRIKNNFTQGQLGEQVGVSQQHISKIENGEFSSVVTIEKVMLAIGYTVRMQVVRLDAKVRDKIKQIIASQSEESLVAKF